MKLTDYDIRKVLSELPVGIVSFLQENKVYLAGGFIRAVLAGEEPNDIDLFSENSVRATSMAIKLSCQMYNEMIYTTVNAHTLRGEDMPVVQFIYAWTFSNAHALISSFDYTISQAAIWFENGEWQSIAAETFYDDLREKQLVYTTPERHEEAGGSLLRMRKFLKAGYDISSYDMAKVITRLFRGIDVHAFAESDEMERATLINEILTDAYGAPTEEAEE